MLKQRIISTLKFFDLQGYPLTLFELHKFLLADLEELKKSINTQWELVKGNGNNENNKATINQITECLDAECQNEVEQKHGFYCLRGRSSIIDARLSNYIYGIKRERRIRRFASGLRYLPFVRGAALAGSQAQGVQKPDSDIDLLIIVDPKFLWLGRTVVTAYFQILGMRRHGKKISGRFCLNHYLAGVKTITELRNLYTAWEYAKLRPLIYGEVTAEFQKSNFSWIRVFFPNFEPLVPEKSNPSRAQQGIERLFSGRFGQILEKFLCAWQLPKIRREEFILVLPDELSFHPQSKQRQLLQSFLF